MTTVSYLAALAAAVLIAGCAHKPVSTACAQNPVPIGVPAPLSDGYMSTEAVQSAEPGARPNYVDALSAALGPSRDELPPGAAATPMSPDSILLMSGGSQQGAFGAGLLSGWQAAAGGLPAFRVVTGVSTGSLLGSFAFVGRGDLAAEGYRINSEADLLIAFAHGKSDVVKILRKGAIADLSPLLAWLRPRIVPLLPAIAAGADDHRRFYVGVVDVDDRQGYAFDMTAIATEWRDAGSAETRARAEQCYLTVLLASSSAPLAALPVFINNRMFIDGGARFGMFFAATDFALQRRAAVQRQIGAAAAAPLTYLIVNGTLATAPADCVYAGTPAAGCPATHPDWNVADLGLSSVDILQNQVYRFSADYAAQRNAADSTARPFRFAKIEPDALDFETALDGATGVKSCKAWRDIDQAPATGAKPVQFDKFYMRCLIKYGERRAANLKGTWYP